MRRREPGSLRLNGIGDLLPPHWLHRSPGAAAGAPSNETDALIQLVQGD
ncbi:hypothetical protein [Gulosibacter sediminis]|nr:hypothetical protein [Gulosibacter sediminis]